MEAKTSQRLQGRPATFCLVTLGCAKNEVDSDRMRALLLGAGLEEVEDAATADVAIVNTCSFLTSATQESIEATLELAEMRSEGVRRLPIVMCGCVPSRYGDELRRELPEVAAFVRADQEDGIASVVSAVLGRSVEPSEKAGRVLRTVESASAFVKISDGCDRYCAFCAIPNIRGRYASRSSEDILAEVSALMEGGVREVVLIGQDTGVWGCDLAGGHDLAWLLERVAEVVRPYGGWVRVLYLQPEGMDERLVCVLRDVPEVLPYIDIPIQHCNARVLRSMGRSGSAPELMRLFGSLREQIPGLVLRSTGLVGFPGETEEEFEELVDFCDEVGFDYLSVFAYSPEEGTEAAAMEGQVPDEVRLDRAQQLSDVAERLGFAATARHVGEVVDVVVDGVEELDGRMELVGHAWFQAPDSDGAVHIESGEAAVGDVVPCRLTGAFCYELTAEMLVPSEEDDLA